MAVWSLSEFGLRIKKKNVNFLILNTEIYEGFIHPTCGDKMQREVLKKR
jgi:hypothetical protein